jgi:transposase
MRVKKSNKRREILLFPPSLEEMIWDDNIVRLIDLFVDHLDLESHGFIMRRKNKHEAGPPQYAPSDLLKIYLYGYYNRTRSSRRLERCCQINIEMMWLINGLTPGYVTISNFRKDNPKAFKQVFRTYNRFLDGRDLFGKTTIAVDSSKFRAQNSKKNNYSDSTIERNQKHIDKKTEEYLALLDQTDQKENQEQSSRLIKEKLVQLSERKEKYNKLKAELEDAKQAGQKQISTIDADARLLTSLGSKGIVGYNVQCVVDDKNSLIVDNEVTNQGDQNALHKMANNAKELLQVDHIKVLADSGYDSGEELMKCTKVAITTYVSPRNQAASQKDNKFRKNKFTYNKKKDTYTCPQGNILVSNGKGYIKKRKGKKDSKFKEYKLDYSKCNACEFKNICAGKRLNRNQGRVIERYEFADYTEANQQRIKENKAYYRRRKAIVEHPFGTIKRQWGYTYTLLKGKEKVGGEFDLICLIYNIRRSVSILGVKELIRTLKALKIDFWSCENPFLVHLKPNKPLSVKIIDFKNIIPRLRHINKCA